jgi:hypothetical protein
MSRELANLMKEIPRQAHLFISFASSQGQSPDPFEGQVR